MTRNSSGNQSRRRIAVSNNSGGGEGQIFDMPEIEWRTNVGTAQTRVYDVVSDPQELCLECEWGLNRVPESICKRVGTHDRGLRVKRLRSAGAKLRRSRE